MNFFLPVHLKICPLGGSAAPSQNLKRKLRRSGSIDDLCRDESPCLLNSDLLRKKLRRLIAALTNMFVSWAGKAKFESAALISVVLTVCFLHFPLFFYTVCGSFCWAAAKLTLCERWGGKQKRAWVGQISVVRELISVSVTFFSRFERILRTASVNGAAPPKWRFVFELQS